MSYKTLFIDAQYAEAVSAALKREGWDVSAADLRADGFLANMIEASDLREAAEAALRAMEAEEDGNDGESLRRLTSIQNALSTF